MDDLKEAEQIIKWYEACSHDLQTPEHYRAFTALNERARVLLARLRSRETERPVEAPEYVYLKVHQEGSLTACRYRFDSIVKPEDVKPMCSCGSYKDREPCATFVSNGNGVCTYCDHVIGCHSTEDVK